MRAGPAQGELGLLASLGPLCHRAGMRRVPGVLLSSRRGSIPPCQAAGKKESKSSVQTIHQFDNRLLNNQFLLHMSYGLGGKCLFLSHVVTGLSSASHQP